MFANRVAIVTGGGSGIGRALTQKLAQEQANVLVADQNLDNANQTLNLLETGNQQKHFAVQVDVSKQESVKAMFDAVKKSYGSDAVATMLANCAGITKDGWMVDMSLEQYQQVLNVNLNGTFMPTQLACKAMIDAEKSGSIVNISSIAAKYGNMGQINYVSSKAAVEGLTRTVAREMGKYNIRCNAVIPGFIETPMVQTVPEKLMMGMLFMTPLARTGQPEEVAEAIKFLLSDQSSYVTGAMLQVSGGLFM